MGDSSFESIVKKSKAASFLDKDDLLLKGGNGTVLVDFKSDDYRAFCVCIHPTFGLLMLHCTRKKNKGPHYQLAGGHVDEPEFVAAAHQSGNALGQLYLAARAGLARELFEETGINVQETPDRLRPVILRQTQKTDKTGKELLPNEYKHRLFFVLQVTDQDFFRPSDDYSVRLLRPNSDIGKDLLLKLSIEHSGFIFEKDPSTAIDMLKEHSGGKVSEVLKMAVGVE